MPNNRAEIFRILLRALWLRPESAMWYSHMLNEAKNFGATELPQPNMEFGCMDGLNGFVLLGGEIPITFDVFSEVQWDRQAHLRSTLSDDYFDKISPECLKRLDLPLLSGAAFDHGVDWKNSHLQKAARFGAHKELTLWDPSSPMSRFDDDSIGGIWAPNIYWMKNVSFILNEFKRIVRPGGKIITIGPDLKLLDHMIFPIAAKLDKKFAADLDRGRFENATSNSRTSEDWENLFSSAGLQVVKQGSFIPNVVADIYEIGMRPMFPVFMNMYEKLLAASPDEWLSFKKDWIARIDLLLSPFVDDEILSNFGHERLWHIFELRPQKGNP